PVDEAVFSAPCPDTFLSRPAYLWPFAPIGSNPSAKISKTTPFMKDLIGKALLDYQTNNNPGKLWAATSISDADEMELAHLFRDFGQMPIIEQKAIELARGKVLDVGCGSGSHSLELQR